MFKYASTKITVANQSSVGPVSTGSIWGTFQTASVAPASFWWPTRVRAPHSESSESDDCHASSKIVATVSCSPSRATIDYEYEPNSEDAALFASAVTNLIVPRKQNRFTKRSTWSVWMDEKWNWSNSECARHVRCSSSLGHWWLCERIERV